jgi:DNA processing protein
MITERSPDELRGWLRLTLTEGLGPVGAAQLLQQLGSPRAVLASTGHTLEALGLRPALVRRLLQPEPERLALMEQILAWAPRTGGHLVTLADPDYPAWLAQIHDPPLVLYVRGERHWLKRPMLAVVGSRNATLHGIDTATELAAQLSQAGWTLVSGLALGIDMAAHQGALQGPGSTLAVMGCGIDQIYPRRHQALGQQIAEQGALVSELPPGTPPAAAFFPRRNRLIAGLAQGVVVVEAALHSGSLITARLASEAGREVFAVPGPVRSGVSRGCHLLLREGATLVESAADVLAVCPAPTIAQPASSRPSTGLPPSPGVLPSASGALPPDPLQQRILAALQGGAAHPDQLAAHLGQPVHTLAAALLELELQGWLVTGAQGLLSPFQPGHQLASAQFRLL